MFQDTYKKCLATVCYIVGVIPSISHAINIIVPKPSNSPDIDTTTQIPADEGFFRSTLQFINEYLRFMLIVVALGVLIYIGITLMTNPGEDGRKKIGKALISITIGILIAVISYVFINLMANLL